MDSDYASTAPEYFQKWCPGCPEERKDLTNSATLEYCKEHYPKSDGESDRLVSSGNWWPDTTPDGSERRLCDFLHRGLIHPHG